MIRVGVIRATVLAVLAVQLGAGTVLGAPAARGDVQGYVILVEGGDVIVDIGTAQGASVGDLVELWRPIEVVHPVTKQRIKDRYQIGTLKVVQIRNRVAVATPEASKEEPVPGDIVVWRRSPPEPTESPPAAPPAAVSPAPAASPAATPNRAVEDEARRVAALFESLREAPLVDRIRAYVAYVKKNPQSPFALVLREDAALYHRLLNTGNGGASGQGAVSPAAFTPATTRVAAPMNFEPPDHAVAGRDLDVGIHLGAPLTAAVLHVRSHEAVGYRTFVMKAAGSGHFRATVPGLFMLPPRAEYFIEGVDAEGRASAVAGTDGEPFIIEIERRPDAEPPTLQKRTTLSVLTDWADFNRLRTDRMDRTWQTEGFVGMRFDDIGVRALRTGFGVYRGVSGSLDELDDMTIAEPRLRNVGLTYGYLEGEFGIVHSASVIARAVAGLTEAGIASGALAMVRIGNDLETNLSLGGEILGGVGLRSIVQLELHPAPRFPVILRSEVTNQPAGTSNPDSGGSPAFQGAIGLRGITQFGYEFVPGFVAALRLSYQGRTIYHAGPGFGGALSYSW